MKRVGKWLVLGVSVLSALASAMYSTYGMAQLLPENLAFHGLLVLGLGYIWILGSFYLTIILHELGHAFCGWLTGYELVALGIGNRLLVNTDQGWKWKKTVILQGAAAQYIGVKKDERDKRFFLMFAGGLLVHLCLIFLFILIGFWTGYWALATSQIMLNVSLFFLNVTPSGIQDGAKLWELSHYPEHIPYSYAALRHAAQVMLAPEQAELRAFVLDIPILPGHLAQVHYLNASEIKIFDGDLEEASHRLEALIAQSNNDYILSSAKAILLGVYLLSENWDKARELGKEKQVMAVLAHPMANTQAIAALYHLRITENKKALNKALKKGKKSMDCSPMLRDEKAFYGTLLKEVEEEAMRQGLLATNQ